MFKFFVLTSGASVVVSSAGQVAAPVVNDPQKANDQTEVKTKVEDLLTEKLTSVSNISDSLLVSETVDLRYSSFAVESQIKIHHMHIKIAEEQLGKLLLENSKLEAEKTLYTELKDAINIKISSIVATNYKIESELSSSPKNYTLKKESGSTETRQHYLIALVPLDEKIKTILEGDTTNLGKLTTFNK